MDYGTNIFFTAVKGKGLSRIYSLIAGVRITANKLPGTGTYLLLIEGTVPISSPTCGRVRRHLRTV
jgi:hypothetical protein